MGVRLSYCVNDEVVKLILSPLSDRDPEETFNRSKKGRLLYFGAAEGPPRVEGQEGWRGTKVEERGVYHRCSLPLDTRHSVFGNLKPDT